LTYDLVDFLNTLFANFARSYYFTTHYFSLQVGDLIIKFLPLMYKWNSHNLFLSAEDHFYSHQ